MSDPSTFQRKKREEQLRSTISQKLDDTGERERLEELLRTKLIECGWRDELKAYCKEIIKNKGAERISVEELVLEVTPRGRATVPDPVKAEILNKIRNFIQSM